MKKLSELGMNNTTVPPVDQDNIKQPQEKELEDVIKQVSNVLEKTKQEEWELELKQFGMSKEEAANILDTIITSGFYEETYRYGKTVFKLRTRTAADSDRLMEMIQEFDPKSNGVLAHLIARINLASSLQSYGDSTFSFTDPTDNNRGVLDSEFKERHNFISRIPQATFFSLSQVLERFDKRVSLASDPRSLENF
jgi:hypothetical protein